MQIINLKKLSRRDRRALGIGAALLVIVVLGLYVILPFYEAQGRISQEVKSQEKLLIRSVNVIQKTSQYLVRLQTLDRQLDGYRQQLLDAADSSVASSQLEELVRRLATQNGVKVVRTNPLPERKTEEQYSKIMLQMNLEARIPELVNFLYAISMSRKFLLVEDFYLATFRVRNRIRVRPRINVSAFIRLF